MGRLGVFVHGTHLTQSTATGAMERLSLALFRNVNGRCQVGARALHAARIWPGRTLLDPLAVVAGRRPPVPAWASRTPDQIWLDLCQAIGSQLNLASPTNLALPSAFIERASNLGLSSTVTVIDGSACAAVALSEVAGTGPHLLLCADPVHIHLMLCQVDQGLRQVERRWLLPLADDQSTPIDLGAVLQHLTATYPALQGVESIWLVEGTPAVGGIATPCRSLKAARVARVAARIEPSQLPTLPAPHSLEPWVRASAEALVQGMQRRFAAMAGAGVRRVMGLLEIALRETKGEEAATMHAHLDQWERSDASPEMVVTSLSSYIVSGQFRQRTVALVSPFSFGKSTLLNALIGEPLLQADQRAETAHVTRILRAKTYALLSQRAGRIMWQTFPNAEELRGALTDLTSVRGQQAGAVTELWVGLPLPIQCAGLLFLDTPGYFSMHQDHDEEADHAVAEADLVVMVHDPEKIGEAHFATKIQGARAVGKRILHVVGKRDLILGEEEKVVRDLRDALGKGAGRIILASGYHGLHGKLWRQGRKSLREVQRDRDLFVVADGEVLQGRDLAEGHAEQMVRFSNIDQLLYAISVAVGGLT